MANAATLLKKRLNKNEREENNMRKKILSAILVVAIGMLCLAGCGTKKGSADQTEAANAKEINVMIWDSTYPDGIFEQFDYQDGVR